MAAPQSGTSACARGQLLSSMATAPWQLARRGGSGSSAPEKPGISTPDAPPPSAQRAAQQQGGNCDSEERPRTAREAGGNIGRDWARSLLGDTERETSWVLATSGHSLCTLARFSHPYASFRSFYPLCKELIGEQGRASVFKHQLSSCSHTVSFFFSPLEPYFITLVHHR